MMNTGISQQVGSFKYSSILDSNNVLMSMLHVCYICMFFNMQIKWVWIVTKEETCTIHIHKPLGNGVVIAFLRGLCFVIFVEVVLCFTGFLLS